MPRLIQQSVVLPAPSERLYDMYLDPTAHAAFTGALATICAAPDSAFEAFGGAGPMACPSIEKGVTNDGPVTIGLRVDAAATVPR